MKNYSKSIQKKFNQNGYVLLKGFLDLNSCRKLTDHLFSLHNENKTSKDDQCPLSNAVYGDSAFDNVLEQLLPNVELASGKKLLPTYSYARIYRSGEDLAAHTDRPACEISITLTLGLDSKAKPWPIFMGYKKGKKTICESEINMEVGDAVLYRGIEKTHWRKKFKGEWQAQVFFHYVDANGTNTEHVFDKRPALAHSITHSKIIPSFDRLFCCIENIYSENTLKKIIDDCTGNNLNPALIGNGKNGTAALNKDIRDVSKCLLDVYRGVPPLLTGLGLLANHENWKFKITHSNQSEFLRYDNNGHYVTHIDTFFDGPPGNDTRKLTVLLFLNKDYEGGKFYLHYGTNKLYPPQDPGTVIIFPSFIPHGVEPVTRGVRMSIVNWMVGPPFN